MLFVGIDWAGSKLDFELRSGNEVLEEGEVPTTFEGLQELFPRLERHGGADQIAVGLEATQAAWIQALLDRGYRVYPLNPKMVERFRESLSAAGHKSDKIDRRVIALFLSTMHERLRPLRPDAPEIVALRIACEDRIRLVKERTAKLNELQALLKAFYPAFEGFFGSLESDIALAFLAEFPTQNQMRALTPRKLAGWLRRKGYAHPSRLEEMQGRLTAEVLSVPTHLQEAKSGRLRYLVSSLKMLNDEIRAREKGITEQFQQLPEATWCASLPGAGPTLAPALLACVGRDPERFATVDEARALMGTAPVTRQSGSTRRVFFRRGCWKFARRTMHLFAEQSRFDCAWAQEYYEKKRAAGHKHAAALRALGHKWLKILLALKRTGRPYDEAVFLHSRQRYLVNSPAASAT